MSDRVTFDSPDTEIYVGGIRYSLVPTTLPDAYRWRYQPGGRADIQVVGARVVAAKRYETMLPAYDQSLSALDRANLFERMNIGLQIVNDPNNGAIVLRTLLGWTYAEQVLAIQPGQAATEGEGLQMLLSLALPTIFSSFAGALNASDLVQMGDAIVEHQDTLSRELRASGHIYATTGNVEDLVVYENRVRMPMAPIMQADGLAFARHYLGDKPWMQPVANKSEAREMEWRYARKASPNTKTKRRIALHGN